VAGRGGGEGEGGGGGGEGGGGEGGSDPGGGNEFVGFIDAASHRFQNRKADSTKTGYEVMLAPQVPLRPNPSQAPANALYPCSAPVLARAFHGLAAQASSALQGEAKDEYSWRMPSEAQRERKCAEREGKWVQEGRQVGPRGVASGPGPPPLFTGVSKGPGGRAALVVLCHAESIRSPVDSRLSDATSK